LDYGSKLKLYVLTLLYIQETMSMFYIISYTSFNTGRHMLVHLTTYKNSHRFIVTIHVRAPDGKVSFESWLINNLNVALEQL